MSGRTTEVLTLTTATLLPTNPLWIRRSVVVQNLGPNPIYVAYSAAACVATKAFRLAQYDTFSVTGQGFTLYAVTTVDQTTGAATIVMEIEP